MSNKIVNSDKKAQNSFDMKPTNHQNNTSDDAEDVDSTIVQTKSNNKDRIIQTVVDLAVIIIVFVILAMVYFLVEPKILYFTCNDSDIFYPYASDTVQLWVVGVYGTIGPIFFILLVELKNTFLNKKSSKQARSSRFKEFAICSFHAVSLFILGLAITLLLTEIGKRWIGRLRPHFMDVCKPNYALINCTTQTASGTVYNSIYTGGSFCTGSAANVKEARFSFPSGHSSFSCYTMIFLIVYLEARLVLLRLRFIKPLLQMTAFIAAFVTCLSRISDYHHRGSDVFGGCVLGLAIGLFITLVIGRVLWEYKVIERYHEIEMKKS